MKKLSALILLALIAPAHAAAPGEWRPLLDEQLSQFDVYLSYRGDQIMSVLQDKSPALKPVGLNPPQQTVFTVSKKEGAPVLRISGEIYGCISTRQEFADYHLRAKYNQRGVAATEDRSPGAAHR